MTAVLRHPISWFALLVVACASPGDAPDESTATSALVFVPQQGRLLLGFKDSDVRTFTFTGAPVTVTDNGLLSNGTISGKGFRGARLTAIGNGVTYRMQIRDVIPPVAPDRQWQYVLDQLDPATGLYVPACDEPTPIVPLQDPPESPIRAYAMPGTWSAAGGFFPSSTSVTFACKTGVVGKCVTWGFGADRPWPAQTIRGVASTADAYDMLQSCTRMARADYCATGLPNTLDGTPIRIDTPFAQMTPDPQFPFEAAWTGEAAIRGRFVPRNVVCLSKLRWSTLPLGGTCPLTIPDPRLDGKGTFCEDMSLTTMEERGAHVYSSSMFLDAGLYTYRDPNTRAQLTTSSLVPGKAGSLPTWTIQPPAGLGFPFNTDRPRFEATVFMPKLPPSTIPDANLVQLTSYACADDLITTSADPGDPSCQPIALEGWVYPPNTPGRAPLRRWADPATKHSWTTARAPSSMLADGYVAQEVVGGVLRAAIDVNVRWGHLASAYRYALDVQTRTGEWIPSCSGTAPLAATELTFSDRCQAPLRDVNHSNILAFRVVATAFGLPTIVSPPVLYDGFSSDVYVPFGNDRTTAVAIDWNDAGVGVKYRLWFDSGDGYQRCADTDQLANDTRYVHVDKCYLDGHSVRIEGVKSVLVCAVGKDGGDAGCGEASYNGHDPSVTITLPPAKL